MVVKEPATQVTSNECLINTGPYIAIGGGGNKEERGGAVALAIKTKQVVYTKINHVKKHQCGVFP